MPFIIHMCTADTTIFHIIASNDDDPKSISNGVHIPFRRGDSTVMRLFGYYSTRRLQYRFYRQHHPPKRKVVSGRQLQNIRDSLTKRNTLTD